jgi:phenylpropionate dioxygenase-like ring-hydroxylating dioxygenase large terminal subunit
MQSQKLVVPYMQEQYASPGGQINLSMATPMFRAKGQQESQTHLPYSHHLYLAGVVQSEEQNVFKRLNDATFMKELTKDAATAVYNFQYDSTNEWKRSTFENLTSRTNNTIQLLGMAHHLHFNCEPHYKCLYNSIFLPFHVPQTEARHIVPAAAIFTEAELDEVSEATRK